MKPLFGVAVFGLLPVPPMPACNAGVGNPDDRPAAASLLQRVRSTKDRRRVGLELTPDGRAILRRIRARRTTWLADRLDRLSAEDRELVERALPALDALLEPRP